MSRKKLSNKNIGDENEDDDEYDSALTHQHHRFSSDCFVVSLLAMTLASEKPL